MQAVPDHHNPCVRCGKPRIVAKTWEETIGHSLTIFSITVCPDKDCQAVVDRDNARQEARRVQEKEARELHKKNLAIQEAARQTTKTTKKR